MKIEISEYQIVHAKLPNREHARWSFLLYPKVGQAEPEVVVCPFYGTLHQAKKWFNNNVGTAGVRMVQVAP